MKLVRKAENGIRVYRSGNRFVASYPTAGVPRGSRWPIPRAFAIGRYATIDEAEKWGKVAMATKGHKVPLADVRKAIKNLRAARLEAEQAYQQEEAQT